MEEAFQLATSFDSLKKQQQQQQRQSTVTSLEVKEPAAKDLKAQLMMDQKAQKRSQTAQQSRDSRTPPSKSRQNSHPVDVKSNGDPPTPPPKTGFHTISNAKSLAKKDTDAMFMSLRERSSSSNGAVSLSSSRGDKENGSSSIVSEIFASYAEEDELAIPPVTESSSLSSSSSSSVSASPVKALLPDVSAKQQQSLPRRKQSMDLLNWRPSNDRKKLLAKFLPFMNMFTSDQRGVNDRRRLRRSRSFGDLGSTTGRQHQGPVYEISAPTNFHHHGHIGLQQGQFTYKNVPKEWERQLLEKL